MRLIKAIEISGFRSIDEMKIDGLENLSVIFGRNDAGKSNVLRALNLFFNGETNVGEQFDSARDVHVGRSGKRKRVQIRVRFHAIPRYGSLGSDFWISKWWSPGGTRTNYPRSTTGARQKSATQLLGNIQYHYIPAIKSNEIFQTLLGEVYAILTKDAQFVDSLAKFTKEVRQRTTALSRGLRDNLGLTSSLAPPTDLETLFRTLDFQTGREQQFSLLLQRGDGIKVRHIPEILNFICEHRASRFHIWGFEEPENSLEYANAIAEANAFLRYSRSPHTQVFITSHSPAFYNLAQDGVSRYHVSKTRHEIVETGTLPGTTVVRVKDGDGAAELMGESELLAEMARRLRELQEEDRDRLEQAETLRSQIHKLERAAATRSKPVLFVEGKSDLTIIEAACSVLYPKLKMPFVLQSTDGTSKMAALSGRGQSLELLSGGRSIYVLVDNDPEGRAARRTPALGKSPTKWTLMDNGTWWARLAFSKEFRELMKDLRIAENEWAFTIEHTFPSELIERALAEGAYKHGAPISTCTWPKVWDRAQRHLDTAARRFLFAPHWEIKTRFADWIREHASDPSDFEQLKPLLDGLIELCAHSEQPGGQSC